EREIDPVPYDVAVPCEFLGGASDEWLTDRDGFPALQFRQDFPLLARLPEPGCDPKARQSLLLRNERGSQTEPRRVPQAVRPLTPRRIDFADRLSRSRDRLQSDRRGSQAYGESAISRAVEGNRHRLVPEPFHDQLHGNH